MTPSFIHLRLHSEFSLVDGVVRIKPLVKRCIELGMPAVALTDQTNFYALIKFYKAAQGAGIKPIVGTDVVLRDADDHTLQSDMCLLAMNQQGYRNLTELMSRAWLENQHHGMAFVDPAWLADYAEGLIVLSGGRRGDVGQALLAGNVEQARERLQHWLKVFPDRFYLELQRSHREYEEEYLHAVLELAAEFNCPVVATNDVRFLKREQYEAHEVRVCIQEGRTLADPRRSRRYSEEQYLKTPQEMAELFSDIPEALQNSVEISKRCNVELRLGKYFLPEYPIPEGLTEEQFFRQVSHQGLDVRFEKLLDKNSADYSEKLKTYRDRLDFELNVIIQMGFSGYFLIVMDFIGWAKKNAIPVGPGRGSGAGSLVAYALDITDLDPLAYDLLFERFLNPERVSMPDFDIDFCMDNRDRVIQYVADTYGRNAVSQIITFGTMAAKAVVRDVARVQGKSYGLADKLSKLIPFEVGMTLEKGFEKEPALREFLDGDSDAKEIWDMAVQLEGIARNPGKHAGGVVIAPSKLTDFSPLYSDGAGGGLVTQFDKNDVEEAGLVKFDFLGLRTLTIIDWALAMVNRKRLRQQEAAMNIMEIPLTDAPTFKLLQSAQTTAVFQLESRGMKELIKKLKPDNFEDIIALVALFRPGPLESGMVDDFINRKHARAKVAYPTVELHHDELEPVLRPTYGVIVYQEQVMQISQVLASYTLGGADMLRRAMGKKDVEKMAKERAKFVEGATGRGIRPQQSGGIFDLMEKFAGYGFNKSHSAAYALVSYQTAWLKTHYPAEFMAATMSSDMDKTEKVVTFIEEARAINLDVVPPDVNQGEYRFTVDLNNRIIYGLGAIKGLGEGPVESIIAARESGAFTDLFDFCARTDSRKVNKRAIDALIKSGAFDSLGESRSMLMAAMPEAMKAAEQRASNDAAGMTDLFGDVIEVQQQGDVYAEFRQVREWSSKERLENEKETLGLFVTGHPIDDYLGELQQLVKHRISDLKPERESQTVAGLIVAMRLMKNKRGDNMAFLTLDDRSGRIEVALFADVYTQAKDGLHKDAIVVVDGAVSNDDYSGELKMRAKTVRNLMDARAERVRALAITLASDKLPENFAPKLANVLKPYLQGNCAIRVDYRGDTSHARLRMGELWKIKPSDELLIELRRWLGSENVVLEY
jgi:DNA polymerase-3 subunit alpha